ncbi:hypothetical protein PMAYCL1PPCAC_05348, partial [Pristionchus mayeri]
AMSSASDEYISEREPLKYPTVYVPNRYATPTEFSNAVLIVEGKKLHVSKEFLAIHSPVFTTMFFGASVEKDQEEFEIEEVVYEEFLDLLNVIHPGYSPITDSSDSYLTKLADQFQMEHALRQCHQFLCCSDHVSEDMKVFLVAQQKMQKRMMANAPNPFTAPSKLSNVVLIVEGRKLHVSKQYLSIHSPVFAALFFGDFAEKGKGEIEIKDVAFDEFSDLLQTIYPSFSVITFASASHVLKLADRFQLKEAHEQAELFLLSDDSVDESEKLALAEQYNLSKLKENLTDLPFSVSSDLSNVVLNVKGEKLYVNKEYISIHSPAFARMFDEASKKGKDEVEIKDATYGEFIDLLNVIYPGFTTITGSSLKLLLRLGYKYEVKEVIDQSTIFLGKTYEYSEQKKRRLANKYKMPADFKVMKGDDDADAFASPSQFSNVVLIIEGKKLHVSKEYLAVHSPIFDEMFFGDFDARGKKEFVIEDVLYEEFVDLLRVIYPGFTKITGISVSHILKLSELFQMKDAREQATRFLVKTDAVDANDKLLLADKYDLDDVKESALRSLNCVFDGRKIINTYDVVSDETSNDIGGRLMELLYEGRCECSC